jgi:hypothetical protein
MTNLKRITRYLLSPDGITTICGMVGGFSALLLRVEKISENDALLIGGIAWIVHGAITNRKSPIRPTHSLSHLGVSTYQEIDSAFAESLNEEPPRRASRTRGVNAPAPIDSADRQSPESTGMGDRVNPLSNRESPLNSDDHNSEF